MVGGEIQVLGAGSSAGLQNSLSLPSRCPAPEATVAV